MYLLFVCTSTRVRNKCRALSSIIMGRCRYLGHPGGTAGGGTDGAGESGDRGPDRGEGPFGWPWGLAGMEEEGNMWRGRGQGMGGTCGCT